MGFVRKAKWAVIGGVLFMYTTSALMFTNNFYWNLSAYLVIGYIFGNWAGQEDKEQARREKKDGK